MRHMSDWHEMIFLVMNEWLRELKAEETRLEIATMDLEDNATQDTTLVFLKDLKPLITKQKKFWK